MEEKGKLLAASPFNRPPCIIGFNPGKPFVLLRCFQQVNPTIYKDVNPCMPTIIIAQYKPGFVPQVM